MPSTFSGVLLVAGLPEHGSLSIDSRPSLKHLCHTFICAALIASSPKAFWVIQIVSVEECSSLTQNLMQSHCSTCSVTLSVTATQYTGSLNASTAPTNQYSEVITVQTYTFQPPPLGFQVTSLSCKPFLLYWQWLNIFRTDLVYSNVSNHLQLEAVKNLNQILFISFLRNRCYFFKQF